MNGIEIKPIKVDDIEVLQIISKQTFFETFSSFNTAENMNAYTAQNFTIDKLINEVNNFNSSFYFAKIDDKIIGYIKVNVADAQTEIKDENALEIERIYVLKEYHGKQVGQLLLNTALQLAEQVKADCVWLGVWEDNAKAIRFYKKNGFVAFDKHIFTLGDDEQTDIMMKLLLQQ